MILLHIIQYLATGAVLIFFLCIALSLIFQKERDEEECPHGGKDRGSCAECCHLRFNSDDPRKGDR